jgi:hypothetical protein
LFFSIVIDFGSRDAEVITEMFVKDKTRYVIVITIANSCKNFKRYDGK